MRYYLRRPESIIDKYFNEFSQPTDLGNNLDLYKQDNQYHLELDLPGFKKEDISIEFKEDVLTIEAKHQEEVKETDSKEDNEKTDVVEPKKEYIYQSRKSTNMKRQIRFYGVDVEKVEASFENGVLKMVLPLEEEIVPETKQIELK